MALTREPDAFEIFTTVVSLGLACLEEEIPSICEGVRRAESDADGRFAFRLKGRDTQGSFGNASTMELSAGLARRDGELHGPGTTIRFFVQTTELDIPIRLWETPVAMAREGRTVRISWDAASPDLFPPQPDLSRMRERVRFTSTEGVVVWEEPRSADGVVLDERLLEDRRGSLATHASVRHVPARDAEGSATDVLMRSARFGYESEAGVPISRGKPCLADDTEGRPVAQEPCSLTDGDFKRVFVPLTCQPDDHECYEPQHQSTAVDLGAPSNISLVVVRGCPYSCAGHASPDGQVWTPIGAGGPSDSWPGLALASPQPVHARYVRVSSEDGISELTEVSVWEG